MTPSQPAPIVPRPAPSAGSLAPRRSTEPTRGSVAIQSRRRMSKQRIFTVQEANRLLPRLREAFQEIGEARRELARRMDRLKILDALWGEGIHDPGNPDRGEFLAERAAVRREIQGIQELVERRIVALGVRFPTGGLEHGLVDFPTTLDGRVVYLCWQVGEPRIEAWHELDGGFQGRCPLTEEEAARMGRDEGTGR